MKISVPKFVDTSEEYQKTPGSYVVKNGVVNCTCGELKNTVKLVVPDRGSDAGGQPICMDVDTKVTNFSQHFGKCSKTGKDCVLTAMNKKWHIPAKVPSYVEWVPVPKPRGVYTVADTNLVTPIQISPIILESSLICWHAGTAGMITIEKNGQNSSPFGNINDNPLTGGISLSTQVAVDGVLMNWGEILSILGIASSYAGPIALALLALGVMYWANGTLVIDSNGISIGENDNWWDWVFAPTIPGYVGIASGVRTVIKWADDRSNEEEEEEGDDDDNKIIKEKSRAPKQSDPNSTYQQVDDHGNIVSQTEYNENGQPAARHDKGHSHYDKASKTQYEAEEGHTHHTTYNEHGQPNGEWTGPFEGNF